MASSNKRPVPQIVEKKGSPVLNNDSDSGGRRHVSSSVPRTAFTPRAEKEALNKLKQKMTFSDYSASSSAKSTPTKVVQKPHTAPHKLTSGRSFLKMKVETKSPRNNKKVSGVSTSPYNGKRSVSSDMPSSASYTKLPSSASYTKIPKVESVASSSEEEGELSNSVTISNLLSKLDSIKAFLKEAEDMRKKFIDKKSEPGILAELKKLDKLVEQLQEQESGYLGEILRLMDLDTRFEKGRDEYSDEDEEDEEVEEEEEEEAQRRSLALDSDEQDDRSADGSDDESENLSLRAQMEFEQEAKLQLLALQQQKEMLTQLLVKQKQIQDLEAKQADLLQMKVQAEQQLREAEKKGLELQEEVIREAHAEVSQTDEADLLAKLAELKEKKKRMKKITDLLQSCDEVKDELDGMEEVGKGKVASDASMRRMEQKGAYGVTASAQASGGMSNDRAPTAAREELVTEDSVHSMEKLQQMSREASSARKSLRDAGYVLRETEKPEDSSHSWRTTESSPAYPKKKGGKSKKMVDDSLGQEDSSELERSIVSEYEAKLSKKKEEVLQLLKEREELKATHKRLVNLQKKMNLGPLLIDPNADHDVCSQTDVTGATWGGSTVQSDPEENDETSSTSLPSEVEGNITRDSHDNVEAPNDAATIEQLGGKTPPPSIVVTRHTPRVSENVRPRDPSMDSPYSTRQVKKLKIEESSTMAPRPTNPLLKSSGTAGLSSKGGSLFGQSGGNSMFVPPSSGMTSSTQATPLFTASQGTPTQSHLQQPPAAHDASATSDSSNHQHMATLQSQLSLTSTMCTQLLEGQNNLIKAVCRRLEQPEVHSNTQDQMAAMQQYQLELEAYYHQLCDSYVQLREQQEEQDQDEGTRMPESEEPVSSERGAQVVQEDSSGHQHPPPPMPSAVSFQMEHTEQETDPVSSRHWNSKLGQSAVPEEGPTSFLPPPPPPIAGHYVSPGYLPGENPSVFYSPQKGFSSSGIRPFQFELSPPMHSGMFPSAGYRPPQLLNWPMAGRPPFYPSPLMDPGSNFDPRRQFGSRPTHLSFNAVEQTGRSVGFGILGSPSGVTASSLQVNAPSSPTSVPSGGMQDSNINNDGQESRDTAQQSGAPGAASLALTSAATATGPSVSTAVAEGSELTRKTAIAASQQSRDVDVESMSSLPLDVPDKPHGSITEDEAANFLVFDALRDTIYSEVATLIKENENRPHFLVEIFRELQLLSTDYLRQRALYSLQDLVTRYLTEESAGALGDTDTWRVEESESEEDSSRPPRAFDYAEPVHSASSVSTPTEDQPFAMDSLGETVVRLDKAMARLQMAKRQVEAGESLDVSGELLTEGTSEGEAQHQGFMTFPLLSEVDTQALDGQIKEIMVDVIPLLKSNIESELNSTMKSLLVTKIMDIIIEQEKDETTGYLESFKSQVLASLSALLKKYMGKRLKECGENMLMDISELLFNELVFLRAMQQSGSRQRGLSPPFQQGGSGEALHQVGGAGNYESAAAESMGATTRGGGAEGAGASSLQGAGVADVRGIPNEVGQTNSRSQGMMPLDPTLLQLLSVSANLNLKEEEENLGKSRDDHLAVMWDPTAHSHNRSLSDDQVATGEQLSPANKSQEEQKSPINGSADVYAAIGGVTNGLSTGVKDSSTNKESSDKLHNSLGIEEEVVSAPMTPPTPVASRSQGSTPDYSPGKVEAGASEESNIGKAMSIGKQENGEGEASDQQQPLSPIATSVSLQDTVPRITSMSESTLETRVKVEQQQIEGVDGVLAAMKEQAHPVDMELVGDEMATRVNGV